MKNWISFILFLFILPCSFTFAQSVENPWIKAPIAGMKMTGGYMVIKNDTDKDIALTQVTGTDCEAYEIHTHSMVDGVMKMRQIKELPIKARSFVTLKPKSFHIMMIQLLNKFSEGDSKKMTLHFSNGKTLEINAPIRKIKAN